MAASFRLELTDDELRLVEERMLGAGQAQRLAARTGYERAEVDDAADRWEEFALVCVGLFEKAGLVRKRKRCSFCALVIWPSEVQLDEGVDELCMDCIEEGVEAAKKRGDDGL